MGNTLLFYMLYEELGKGGMEKFACLGPNISPTTSVYPVEPDLSTPLKSPEWNGVSCA